MKRRETEACKQYWRDLDPSHTRMEELVDNGYDALSTFDIEIASGGDREKALWTALYLVGNHVRYFKEKVAECDQIPRQGTLFMLQEARTPDGGC